MSTATCSLNLQLICIYDTGLTDNIFITKKSLGRRLADVNLTNRFRGVSVRVYCNRSQMTSQRGKNQKARHETKSSAVTFFPRYGVFFNLLQYTRT